MSRKITSLLVALLVLGNATGQNSGNDKPAFTRFIGPQTMLFAHYRAGELLRIPAVQTLIAGLPGGKAEMERSFQKDLGLQLEDVDTVTMYLDNLDFEDGQPHPPRPPYILLTTRKNLDFTVIRRSLGSKQETVTFGKYVLTVGEKQALIRLDDRSALFLPDTGGKGIEQLKK